MILSFLKKFFQLREENDQAKPFLQHLEELRWMILKIAFTLIICMSGSFFFRHELFTLLQEPLITVDADMVSRLQTLGVADSLTISIQLSFYAGIIVSFPLLLFYLAQFVLPGLTRKEKKYVLPAIAVGFGLFLIGVAVGYFFVLPQTLEFFAQDAKKLGLTPSWTVREYFSFVTHMLLALGCTFELPIVVMTLVALGVISFEFMNRTRRYAITILFILAAVIAPTPDVLTLLCMAVPMCLLYESCIWLSWMVERRRKRRLELGAAPQ